MKQMKTHITAACIIGLVGSIAILDANPTKRMSGPTRSFEKQAPPYFNNSDEKLEAYLATESTRPGDHMESRSPHKQFPALALDKPEPAPQAATKVISEIQPEEKYTLTEESSGLPFPVDAKPGQCYAEVIVPAKFETVTERVLSQDASSRINVVAAQYEWVEQEVMVKPETVRLEVVPAEYKTVTERVLVEPQSEQLVSVPATFKTVNEKILVRPATQVWKDGEAEIENPNQLTGDIVCLVERPAEYKTVQRQVIDQPARTEIKTIPAVYKTVEKQIIAKPATTREVTIPAEYKTVRVKKMVTPNRTEQIAIQPEYVTVNRYVMVEPAYTKWEMVLCSDTVSPQLALEVEDRLKEEGYNPGPLDGEIDGSTEKAIKQYQIANNLPAGGLTPMTLESLGIVEFEG